MNKPVTITTQIDEETHALVLRVAHAFGRSEQQYLAAAIRKFALSEAQLLDSLDQAERQIDNGEFFTQDEVRTSMADRFAGDARA